MSEPSSIHLSLHQLPIDQDAVILSFRGGSRDDSFAARGLAPGGHVRVVRRGDPLLVAVDDARWAVRVAEAQQIQVLPLDPPGGGREAASSRSLQTLRAAASSGARPSA